MRGHNHPQHQRPRTKTKQSTRPLPTARGLNTLTKENVLVSTQVWGLNTHTVRKDETERKVEQEGKCVPKAWGRLLPHASKRRYIPPLPEHASEITNLPNAIARQLKVKLVIYPRKKAKWSLQLPQRKLPSSQKRSPQIRLPLIKPLAWYLYPSMTTPSSSSRRDFRYPGL